jgi:HSP20 family protein
MTLIRRANNNYPVFQNWFEDFFSPVQNYVNGVSKGSFPAVNVAEDNDKFEIEFAVPGLSKSDFAINLDNDVLTVKSEKENPTEETNTNFTRKEFSYSGFQRSFTLPETADGEKIKAEYKDGILTVEIPKKEQAKVKPAREIQIA